MRRAPPAIATAWRQPFGAANHALAEWLGHLIAVAVLLSGFHAIEALLTRVGLHNRSMTVGSLFDAGDTGLIIGFLVFGVISVLRAYGNERDDEPPFFEASGRYGRVALSMMAALRPAPAAFTIGSFVERLIGQLLVYAAILVVSIYLCVFALAPWRVAIASLVALLLSAIAGAVLFAPRGSLWAKLRWLKKIRAVAGSFVMAFGLLLLIEEILRRSS